MSAPKVSILMATYNYGAFLPRAIDSVLAQTHEDFELVVSDNASLDDTEAIGRHYAALDPRVRYFRNECNVGLAANFNLCQRRANPDSSYLIGLPADDWWTPDLLQSLVALADTHPEVTLVHCDAYRLEHPLGTVLGRYSDLFSAFPPVGVHEAVRELYRNNYIPFQACLLRRAQAAVLLSYADLYAEDIPYTNDYYLWLQLLSRGAKAYYHPEPLAYILKHEQAHTMVRNILTRLEQEIRAFEKLQAACPAELEGERQGAINRRRLALAFALIRAGRAGEAKPLLRQAAQRGAPRRLDVSVARAITALPVSNTLRKQLWQLALGTSAALRGER